MLTSTRTKVTTIRVKGGDIPRFRLITDAGGIWLVIPRTDQPNCVFRSLLLTKANARKLRDALTKAIGDDHG